MPASFIPLLNVRFLTINLLICLFIVTVGVIKKSTLDPEKATPPKYIPLDLSAKRLERLLDGLPIREQISLK